MNEQGSIIKLIGNALSTRLSKCTYLILPCSIEWFSSIFRATKASCNPQKITLLKKTFKSQNYINKLSRFGREVESGNVGRGVMSLIPEAGKHFSEVIRS